jgi:hypothetical protein
MENFDIKKYLIENQLTTNSQQLEENVIKNLIAAALMSLGVAGGVKGQEAPKTVQDTNPITWQQMTQAQKAAVKKALVDKGGYQLFQTYKDSVSTDAENRRNADFAKGAARKGMTVDQYRKYLEKNAKAEPVGLDGLEIGKCNKRSKKTGSCTTGNTGGGQSLRDN